MLFYILVVAFGFTYISGFEQTPESRYGIEGIDSHGQIYSPNKEIVDCAKKHKYDCGYSMAFVIISEINDDERFKGSRGTEFVLAVMEEYYDIGDIIMYVAADENTSMNVFAPHVNICQTIHIKTGVQMLRLNASLRLRGSELVRKGIHVTADKNITVYVMSSDNNEDAEGYLALPTSALSTKYMIVTDYGSYDIWNSTSEFVIAAVDSNTLVQITFKTNGTICINGTCYTSGDTYNITMSELDTLQIQHVHDLTGTFVRSNKPVAVFAGDRCGYGVPGVVQYPACQHEVEQMLPIDILGHDYITTPLYPMEFYRFRIISQFDNTVVFLQGINYTIDSGDFIERLETTPQYIHSSKQIIVMEYGHCHWQRVQINESNPSMITLPPISRYSKNYTFYPVDTFAGDNFISVIIDTDKSEDLMLNFKRPKAIKTFYQGNFTILVAYVERPTNTLYHPDPKVTFGAILYGTRMFGSYGFPLGFTNGHAIIPLMTTKKDSTTTYSATVTTTKILHPSSSSAKNSTTTEHSTAESTIIRTDSTETTSASTISTTSAHAEMSTGPSTSKNQFTTTRSGPVINLNDTGSNVDHLIIGSVVGSVCLLLVSAATVYYCRIARGKRSVPSDYEAMVSTFNPFQR